MKIIRNPGQDSWAELLKRPSIDVSVLESAVREIIAEVRERGDQALVAFAEQFDRAVIAEVAVSLQELEEAEEKLSGELRSAIRTAAENIKRFHAAQASGTLVVETIPGVRCWRRVVPIESVGLYIPGGTAPLFSTVLMLGVPAKLAGCKSVVLCTPPRGDGEIHPAILFAAKLTGVTRVFKAGGAQAVAAMAYGTESVPKVDKIFGPGNQYVTAAKQMVSRSGTAIDLPAGPSEVAVLADGQADPEFIAADLLSQAEHGPDSQVLLATDSEETAAKVIDSLERQLGDLPRAAIARQALSNSLALVMPTIDEALRLVNYYAPEHLIIACEDDENLAEKVINAGSVFLGRYTPEAAGDYASGTNHTLPTGGAARAVSGVSLESFQKKITFQKLSPEGLKALGPVVEIMAEAELLEAHKRAVRIRLKSLSEESF